MIKREKKLILFIVGITVLNAVIFPLINLSTVAQCF
jgi:hypothetical protein